MSSLILLLTLVLIVWCLQEKQGMGPLVYTKSGKIRGHYLKSYKGYEYEAYQGIPFAKPPIGERRFQSPVPIEPWTNELQAIKIRDTCVQDFAYHTNKPVSGSEDCLHLNVYVPTKSKINGSLPVIFYIYGGLFRHGSTIDGQEQYIIDYDVIFASANYRTGSLGFLSTEDDVVSGNMGLKDQSTAIRWIYDNIEHFGGDPKRITLLGSSAGAMSVQYHYFSPWSRGLFHAGITLSGTAFVPAALIRRSRETAIALGREVNCTNVDVGRMIECMKRIPAEVLVGAQNKLEFWHAIPSLFGIVLEKSSVDPFVDDYPSQILKEGRAYDVPLVVGIAADEGLGITAGYASNESLKYFDDNWDFLAPMVLEYVHTIPKEQHARVAAKAREHYLGDKRINRENFKALTSLVGDRTFGVGAVNAVKRQAAASKSPVFFHIYNYRATDSLTDAISNSTENFGVCHGDEVLVVVGNPKIIPTKSPQDMAMQRRLIQMFTSVAYNGVPDAGVEWPIVVGDDKACLDYLYIDGPDNLTSKCSDDMAEHKFWNSIGFDEE